MIFRLQNYEKLKEGQRVVCACMDNNVWRRSALKNLHDKCPVHYYEDSYAYARVHT